MMSGNTVFLCAQWWVILHGHFYPRTNNQITDNAQVPLLYKCWRELSVKLSTLLVTHQAGLCVHGASGSPPPSPPMWQVINLRFCCVSLQRWRVWHGDGDGWWRVTAALSGGAETTYHTGHGEETTRRATKHQTTKIIIWGQPGKKEEEWQINWCCVEPSRKCACLWVVSIEGIERRIYYELHSVPVFT